MNTFRLKILLAIQQHKKLSTAAKHLNIKQPALNFHISKMEEEYGVTLLRRINNTIVFTEAGQSLLNYGEKILMLEEKALWTLEQYATMNKGSLSIGASHVPSAYVIPHIFNSFTKNQSNINLKLKVKTAPMILTMIKNFEIDLGLIMAKSIDDPNLSAIPLIEDQLVLVLYPDHPLATKEIITPEDLVYEPFILHEQSSTTRKLFDEWAKTHHVYYKSKFELGSAEAIKEAIEAKFGISVLTRTALKRELESERLVCRSLPYPIEPHYLYLIYHANHVHTPAFNAFITYISDYFNLSISDN